MKIKNAAILSCLYAGSFWCQSLHADQVNFFFGSDPQYDFYSSTRQARANNTFETLGRLASHCTDCVKLVTVSGDLVHGEGSGTPVEDYCDALKKIPENVQVFDGLGNHDALDFSVECQTSFTVDPFALTDSNSGTARYHWKTYTTMISKVENNLYNHSTPYYSDHQEAYYYSIGIYKQGELDPSAFIVQLHDEFYSDNATKFLEQVHNKLIAENHQSKPIILLAHRKAGNSANYQQADPGNGISEGRFRTLTKSLNVAAVLFGHYKCPDKPGRNKGHCDWQDNGEHELFRHAVELNLTNARDTPIVALNASAMFHNIFWALSLDTKKHEVSFKRLDRRDFDPTDINKKKTLTQLIRQLGEDDKYVYNFPAVNEDFYTCNYKHPSKTKCTDQNEPQGIGRLHSVFASVSPFLYGNRRYLFGQYPKGDKVIHEALAGGKLSTAVKVESSKHILEGFFEKPHEPIKIFKVNSNLFLYGQNEDNDAYIARLIVNQAARSATLTLTYGKRWQDHYPSVAFYEVANRTYMFGQNKDGNTFTAEISTEGKVLPSKRKQWKNFYPTIATYETGGNVFMYGQNDDKEVFIAPINNDGSVGSSVYSATWKNLYSAVPFYVGTSVNRRTFIYGQNDDNTVFIAPINKNGTLGKNTYKSTWKNQYPIAAPLEVNGKTYFFWQKDDEFSIEEINDSGKIAY